MIFAPPLIPARLIRRYKRFLADVSFDAETIVTVSVPNTGAMRGLVEPDNRVWLSYSANKSRKYHYRLEIVETDGQMVGINTSLPNQLALEALHIGLLPELSAYNKIFPEQRYDTKSRIDFLLQNDYLEDCYLEIKNVHFIRKKGLAEFPDTPTARGTKHLQSLIRMVQTGKRAALVYIIQREDCHAFSICEDLDPLYGQMHRLALKAGVEFYAIKCAINTQSICPIQRIEIASHDPIY